MSRFEDNFRNHEIHKNLENLIDSLLELITTEATEEEINEINRLIKIFNKINIIFDNVDTDTFPLNTLSDLNVLITDPNFLQELNNYKSNKNISHIQSANNIVTKRFSSIQLIYSLKEKSDPSHNEYKKAINNYLKYTNKIMQEFDAKLEDISNQSHNNEKSVSKLTKNLENLGQRVDAQINEWQSQFSQSQQSRLNEQNETLTKFRNEFEVFKNNSENSILQIREEYTNLVTESKIDIENEKSSIKNQFSNELEGIVDSSKEIHLKIVDLFHIVSGDSISGKYQRVSDDEKKSADIWRNLSVGSTLAIVIWLLVALFGGLSISENGEIIFGKLIITISITLIMAALSAYCAQQSTKHRNNEIRTQWFALEVSAINPFIENLDEAQKRDLINKLSEKIFGNFDTLLDKSANKDVSANIIIDKITDLLKAARNE